MWQEESLPTLASKNVMCGGWVTRAVSKARKINLLTVIGAQKLYECSNTIWFNDAQKPLTEVGKIDTVEAAMLVTLVNNYLGFWYFLQNSHTFLIPNL
jgi:hypothetical protein